MPLYEKGQEPGPGRPPGSRNKSTLLFDEIGREGIADLIQKVKKKADEGSLRATSMLLARAWPRRHGSPVKLELPPVETAADIVRAHAAVIAAMTSAEITPGEARVVVDVLESQRRAIETLDHEKRLTALEKGMEAL